VAKRLSEIQEKVNSSGVLFFEYLRLRLGEELFNNLSKLSEYTKIYIFSGVIRNFFLKAREFRDIDIVLTDVVDIQKIFCDYEIKRNSFGGYKIFKENEVIDLWYVGNTWGLKFQKHLDFNLDLDRFIPGTSFFNFSSIVFSFNEQRFYCTNHFVRFLQQKKIDIVFEPNANYALCILNTIYYSDKFRLGVAEKLKKHIRYLHKFKTFKEYEAVQLKHFGTVLYSNEEVERKIYSM